MKEQVKSLERTNNETDLTSQLHSKFKNEVIKMLKRELQDFTALCKLDREARGPECSLILPEDDIAGLCSVLLPCPALCLLPQAGLSAGQPPAAAHRGQPHSQEPL